MTTQNVIFKEYEGIVPNPINGPLFDRPPGWSGLIGPPSYGANFVQPKITVAQEPDNQHGLPNGIKSTTHFTLFSGDCKTAENGVKTNLQCDSLVQAQTMEYQGHFSLGFGQSLVYPYAEQCYGVYSTYGTQIPGRIMLPLSLASDGGPIYVNAKQYNRILIRRKSRAKAMENQVLKSRKPYQHLSRHLHAMRRLRGSGGRFLNTKNSNTSTPKTSKQKTDHKKEKHDLQQQTESQISEVLQYDDQGMMNSKGITTTGGNRSTSPGSEVTSHDLFSTIDLFPFDNHHHRSFHSFQSMAAGDYLKI